MNGAPAKPLDTALCIDKGRDTRPNRTHFGCIREIFKSRQIVHGLMLITGLVLSNSSLAITVEGNSSSASLNCTSSPCPWGDTLTRQAVVWPSTVDTVLNRLGYTTSDPIYLTAQYANGAVITNTSGSFSVRKGHPDASAHDTLAILNQGESFTVSGLATDDVLLLSDITGFGFVIDLPDPTAPTDPTTPTDPITGQSSEFVTLSCTSSPCPWGSSPGSNALKWPDTANTVTNRLGYTAPAGVYMVAGDANGTLVTIQSGSASVVAGNPDDTSFRNLAVLNAGESLTITGLLDGEVVAVMNNADSFNYEVVLANPTDPTDPTNPTDPTDPTDPTNPTDPPVGPETGADFVSLTCNGDKCPWGPTPGAYAISWPSTSKPIYERLDYTASHGIYLPRAYANGATISVITGSASLTAGLGNSPSFRTLASLTAGESYTIPLSSMNSGEVVAVTSSNSFTYAVSLSATPAAPVGDVYSSVPTLWRCTSSLDCNSADWEANSITWPDWAAYSSNERSGQNGRTTYGEDGALLYPYMGQWSHGCEVSVEYGIAVIIEWERGADVWRQTPIGPGETHTINLTDPENNALFESWGPFTIAVNNCTPQLLP